MKGIVAYILSKAYTNQAIQQAVIEGVKNYNLTTVATCSTIANESSKVVTINDSSWSLQKGCIIGVKFTNTNTASNVTLNVNNTGAKSIYYDASVYTSSAGDICGTANRTIYYMYDGTYWVWVSSGKNITYTSKPASSGGTEESLVTTGEKYEWNNMLTWNYGL